MLRKDLRKLKIYQPLTKRDESGGEWYEYPAETGEFWGNIQPMTEQSLAEAYGINLKYGCVILTEDDAELREEWAVGENTPDFVIKTIQTWHNFRKLVCDERQHK